MKKFKLITHIDRINFISDTFINYYSKIFDKDEFYFMIKETEYSKIEPYLISKNFKTEQFLKVYKNKFGYGDTSGTMNRLQNFFIEEGYIVMYADIDEIIYHENLKKFILESTEDFFCPYGMKIFQHKEEDFIDSSKTICSQRKFAKHTNHYSKVCIVKKPYFWQTGRHNNRGLETPYENEFYLFDIGEMCLNLKIENNKCNNSIYETVRENYCETDPKIVELIYRTNFKRYVEIPKVVKEKNLF